MLCNRIYVLTTHLHISINTLQLIKLSRKTPKRTKKRRTFPISSGTFAISSGTFAISSGTFATSVGHLNLGHLQSQQDIYMWDSYNLNQSFYAVCLNQLKGARQLRNVCRSHFSFSHTWKLDIFSKSSKVLFIKFNTKLF